jgi:hypothetical protein
MQFTMETESDGTIPFLYVATKKRTGVNHHGLKKPTHTGHYLHFDSNHPPNVKRGTVHSPQSTASAIRQKKQGLFREISNLR